MENILILIIIVSIVLVPVFIVQAKLLAQSVLLINGFTTLLVKVLVLILFIMLLMEFVSLAKILVTHVRLPHNAYPV
jgi:hypothetical protein